MSDAVDFLAELNSDIVATDRDGKVVLGLTTLVAISICLVLTLLHQVPTPLSHGGQGLNEQKRSVRCRSIDAHQPLTFLQRSDNWMRVAKY